MSHNMTPTGRSLLKGALKKIRRLNEELEAAKSQRLNEPIAIVGMSGRFPGAKNVDALWELFRAGESAIKPMPRTRVNSAGAGTYFAALIEDVDLFDNHFFGISDAEARAMDPQHRMLLEVAYESLDDAQQTPQTLPRRTGVFVGLSTHDYAERAATEADVYTATGNGGSFSAGRISHWLGLHGPSVCVDTACSSSLVALHLACQSLRSGESDVALAGGCNLILSTSMMEWMSHTMALSPNGRAATFDAAANGYVRGEGCGVVVLRRLEDAVRNQDNIWAVVRGSAVNHDGASSTLTAPNPLAQQRLLRDAFDNAGVELERTGYVEAHGTGTPLGDPIELDALKSVLGGAVGCDGHCYIGSGKTNVGHLEAAAGMSGLFRAVLALKHREIPPQANFTTPTSHATLSDSTLAIARAPVPWRAEGPRVASVSGFGMSGTNAHLVLEERVAPERPADALRSCPDALVLSAHSEDALRVLARDYRRTMSSTDWRALCRGAAARSSHLPHRAVIIADDEGERSRLLDALGGANPAHAPGLTTGVQSGDASCALILGDDLDENVGDARREWRRAAFQEFQGAVRWDALDDAAANALRRTALRVGDAKYFRQALKVRVLVGVGEGELAAAHVAGLLSLEETAAWATEGSIGTQWSLWLAEHRHNAAIPLLASSTVAAPSESREMAFAELESLGILRALCVGAGQLSAAVEGAGVEVVPAEVPLATVFARLYCHGAAVDWRLLIGRQRVPLPAYPWQRRKHWIAGEQEPITTTYQVQWHPSQTKPSPESSPPSAESRQVVVFGGAGARTEEVAEAFVSRGCRCVVVVVGEQEASEGRKAIRPTSEEIRSLMETLSEPWFVHLPSFAGGDEEAQVKVLLATAQLSPHPICVVRAPGSAPSHLGAGRWGLAKARAVEWPGRRIDLVDTDEASASAWVDTFLRGTHLGERTFRFRDGRCFLPRLTPQPLAHRPLVLDPRASYLVTGGLGGIGRQVAKRLVERGARDVVLVGRTPPTDHDAWLREFAAQGADVRWVAADVTKRGDVQNVVADIGARGRRVRGVFHAAGVGSHTRLDAMTHREYERVVAVKRDAARWLHECCHDLDYFVGFSSLSALLCGAGQGAYSAANQLLDEVIDHRRSLGLAAVSVQWGLWDGEGLPNQDERRVLASIGVHAMAPSEALDLMEAAMHENASPLVAAKVDWTTCLSAMEAREKRPLFDALRPQTADAPSGVVSLSKEQAHAWVHEMAADALGRRRADVDTQRPLSELGLDSLGAIKMRRELRQRGVHLALASILGGASIDRLAAEATPGARAEPEADKCSPSQSSALGKDVTIDASCGQGWFVTPTPRAKSTTRLFCFPYAGGGPSVFLSWGAQMPESLEVLVAQFPARAARLDEAPVVRLEPLITSLVEHIRPLIDRPYAFMGHCFGALVTYELTQRLRAEGLPQPEALFVSGARAPQSYTERQLFLDVEQFSPQPPLQVHQMPDEMLAQALMELEFAASAEALRDPDVRRMLLPAVRADFELSNAYRFSPAPPLEQDIVAMGGRADPYVSADQLLGWREQTSGSFEHRFCSGGHYFIGAERERWVRTIAEWFRSHTEMSL